MQNDGKNTPLKGFQEDLNPAGIPIRTNKNEAELLAKAWIDKNRKYLLQCGLNEILLTGGCYDENADFHYENIVITL